MVGAAADNFAGRQRHHRVFASSHSNYLMPVKHLREGIKGREGGRGGGGEGRERGRQGGNWIGGDLLNSYNNLNILSKRRSKRGTVKLNLFFKNPSGAF